MESAKKRTGEKPRAKRKPGDPVTISTKRKVVEKLLDGQSKLSVARDMDLSPTTVSKIMQQAIDRKLDATRFKELTPDILSHMQHKVLNVMDMSLDGLSKQHFADATLDQKRGMIRDMSVVFGILKDKERLECGKSNSNVYVSMLVQGQRMADPRYHVTQPDNRDTIGVISGVERGDNGKATDNSHAK